MSYYEKTINITNTIVRLMELIDLMHQQTAQASTRVPDARVLPIRRWRFWKKVRT